jgi:HEPN domain-containing protein
MPLSADEWWRQAGRDLRAAEHLLAGDFPAHASVLAHLAVEKAMKSVLRRRGEAVPVTHALRRLADRLGLDAGAEGWSADLQDALDTLADTSILALYAPDRPFGHAVSDEGSLSADAARQRVAAARTVIGWIEGNR